MAHKIVEKDGVRYVAQEVMRFGEGVRVKLLVLGEDGRPQGKEGVETFGWIDAATFDAAGTFRSPAEDGPLSVPGEVERRPVVITIPAGEKTEPKIPLPPDFIQSGEVHTEDLSLAEQAKQQMADALPLIEKLANDPQFREQMAKEGLTFDDTEIAKMKAQVTAADVINENSTESV